MRRRPPRLCGVSAYCSAKRAGDPAWNGPLCPHCAAVEHALAVFERSRPAAVR